MSGIYGKEDWIEFRNEILDLVSLYHQVEEFSEFDKNKIEFVESFFYLSKRNAITAFFIKVGFLLSNGAPTLKNFLSTDNNNELYQLYDSKVKIVRDKMHSHNLKSKLPKNFTFSNEDVEELYAKIISSAQTIDKNYDDNFNYDSVINSEGIKSIESLIDDSNELDTFKNELLEYNFKATVEMDIKTGKVKIVEQS